MAASKRSLGGCFFMLMCRQILQLYDTFLTLRQFCDIYADGEKGMEENERG